MAHKIHGRWVVDAYNMPDNFRDIWEFFRDFRHDDFTVTVEDVGASMPGNSAKSSRTFAEHVGALKMMLIAANLHHTFVPPKRWMKDLFGDKVPKAPKGSDAKTKAAFKKQRKQFIYDEMKKEWPGCDFSLRQADAVAILLWNLKKAGLR